MGFNNLIPDSLIVPVNMEHPKLIYCVIENILYRICFLSNVTLLGVMYLYEYDPQECSVKFLKNIYIYIIFSNISAVIIPQI